MSATSSGSGRVSRSPYWNRARLDTVVAEHCQGVRNHTAEINAILTLAAIDRTLLQGAAQVDEELSGLVQSHDHHENTQAR